jgi:hypothetical protein
MDPLAPLHTPPTVAEGGVVTLYNFTTHRCSPYPGPSFIYFCPKCGQQWARVTGGTDPYWAQLVRPCPFCTPAGGDWVAPAGSLYPGYHTKFYEALPLSTLRIELSLYLQEYENAQTI